MVNVKGNLLYQYRKKTIEILGDETFIKIKSKLNQNSKEVFDGAIISSTFYDISILENFLECMNSIVPEKKMEEIAKSVAETQFIYFGLVFKNMDVDKIISKAEFIWEKLFDSGKIIAKKEENKITIKVTDFKITDSHMITIRSYIQRIAENTLKKKTKAISKKIDEKTSEYIVEY